MTKERNPYEVILLLVFAVQGVAGLVAPTRTSSNTLLTMPTSLLYVWHTALLVSGAVALAGVFAPGLTGHILERTGLTINLLQLAGYGIVLLGLFQWRALFFGAMCLGLAYASLWRIRQINKDLRRLRASTSDDLEG